MEERSITSGNPHSSCESEYCCAGDDLIREPLDPDGQYWSFHGGVYTQYAPQHQTAWLRLLEQMPGISPLDPRNIASLENRSNFVGRLRQDRVLEVGPARTHDGQPG